MLPALLVVLAACSQTVTYYGAQSRELHGSRVLLLRASLLPPTAEALHARVVGRIEQAVAAMPGVGKVLGAADVRAPGVSLAVQDAYALFSNTLSLTGVADPELSRKLHDGLGVQYLAVALPSHLPCPACEQGDEFWLVGYLVEARSGTLVFRTHLRVQGASADPQALDALADDLTTAYLGYFGEAFALRPHIQRFENLRPG